MDIRLGDVCRLKKEHPCGSREWLVYRVGADFKIRCLGCGHEVMLPREKLEKNVKRIIRGETEINPRSGAGPSVSRSSETGATGT